MAGATTFLTLLMWVSGAISVPATNSQEFSTRLSKREMGLKREKLSHLHFYFHDTLSGRNPTAVPVAKAATTDTSATVFGLVMMIDDPLTAGPNMSSKMVGRAQGMYASADEREVGFLMVFSFAFLDGKFNGSTLNMLGRNQVLSAVREMPIVGGSGVFRFARGYSQARTVWSDRNTKNAVVEYDVYVFHY